MKNKIEKRQQALERQEYYDGLSIEDKLDQCDARRGNSTRERQKLNALLVEEAEYNSDIRSNR